MFNRIKALIRMQLADRLPLFKLRGVSKIAIYLGVRLLAFLAVTACFGGVFWFFNGIMSLRVDYNFLVFFIAVTQIVSIITNTNVLIDNLYLSRDNVILFALPATHGEVFVSKLTVYYVEEFRKNIYLLLPAILAFVLFWDVDFWYFLNIIPLIVMLPLLSVLVSAILSLPVMFAKRLFNTFPLLGLAAYLVVFGCAAWLLLAFTQAIPTPFRLLALYKDYMVYVNDFIVTVNSYMPVFRNAVNMMFVLRSGWDYLVVFGSAAVAVVAVYLLAMPFYFKVVGFEKGKTLKKHEDRTRVHSSNYRTFLGKEVKMITRSSQRLISTVYSILSYPIVLYVVNSVLSKINTNELGDRLIISFNIVICLTLLAATNSAAATAVSQEGLEFSVMKTAPSKTYKMAWSKVTVYLAISTLAIILGFIVLTTSTGIGIADNILLLVLIALLNGAQVMWAFQYDLLQPQLADFAATGNANSNKNVGRAVMTGIFMAVVFAVIAVFFFLESKTGAWIRLLALGGGVFALRLILLLWNMKVYFKRIEL